MQSVRDRLEVVLSHLAVRADNESVFVKLYPEAARAAAMPPMVGAEPA